MILYKTGENRQTANYRWYPQGIPYSSWKEKSNIVVVPKNVSNKESGNVNSSCSKLKNNCFKAHPMKHYRKQLTATTSTTSYSRNSIVGSLDKPGNNIITQKTISDSNNDLNELCNKNILLHQNIHILNSNNCEVNSNDKYYDASLNKMVCVSLSAPALVLKPASTNLTTNYSSSNKEYLYKKCKTFQQNSLINNANNAEVGTNYINSTSNNTFNCCNTIGYSNANYKTQGPISSSARTFAKKYESCQNNKTCNSALLKTDYNIFGTQSDFNNKLQLPFKLCCSNKPTFTGTRLLK
tara:strand:+ start:262 stop:1149 length:888 start_codon:yes stop_codon:yes gene_type:complete